MILRYILVSRNPFYIRPSPHRIPRCMPILLVNKQLHNDSLSILYGENTIGFAINQPAIGSPYFLAKLKLFIGLIKKGGDMLNHVAFRIDLEAVDEGVMAARVMHAIFETLHLYRGVDNPLRSLLLEKSRNPVSSDLQEREASVDARAVAAVNMADYLRFLVRTKVAHKVRCKGSFPTLFYRVEEILEGISPLAGWPQNVFNTDEIFGQVCAELCDADDDDDYE